MKRGIVRVEDQSVLFRSIRECVDSEMQKRRFVQQQSVSKDKKLSAQRAEAASDADLSGVRVRSFMLLLLSCLCFVLRTCTYAYSTVGDDFMMSGGKGRGGEGRGGGK